MIGFVYSMMRSLDAQGVTDKKRLFLLALALVTMLSIATVGWTLRSPWTGAGKGDDGGSGDAEGDTVGPLLQSIGLAVASLAILGRSLGGGYSNGGKLLPSFVEVSTPTRRRDSADAGAVDSDIYVESTNKPEPPAPLHQGIAEPPPVTLLTFPGIYTFSQVIAGVSVIAGGRGITLESQSDHVLTERVAVAIGLVAEAFLVGFAMVRVHWVSWRAAKAVRQCVDEANPTAGYNLATSSLTHVSRRIGIPTLAFIGCVALVMVSAFSDAVRVKSWEAQYLWLYSAFALYSGTLLFLVQTLASVRVASTAVATDLRIRATRHDVGVEESVKLGHIADVFLTAPAQMSLGPVAATPDRTGQVTLTIITALLALAGLKLPGIEV
jgi:hypothetical protein